MLSLFELAAALLAVTAGFAWLNCRWLGLPTNIGLLLTGLAASLVLIGIEALVPDTLLYDSLRRTIAQVDFYHALMHGMLSLLLFAGALNVDLGRLRRRAAAVAALATLGVLLSTTIVGLGFWLLANLFGVPLSLAWSFAFGALIAPTDPVAVLSTLKSVAVPETVETDMAGEALFNDGVGVVVFTVIAAALGGGNFGLETIVGLFLVEALGGALLGLAAGFVAYRAMRGIDDYAVEVLITLALVTGTYALADALHISGPIAVVVAGVLIGSAGAAHAMTETTRRYVFSFWTVVDDILNAVLFLLIGLEVLVLNSELTASWVALTAVPLVLAARFVAVGAPMTLLGRWQSFAAGTIPILTWGAIRGGISIALALSLPVGGNRSLVLAATYAVVLFSVVVQGLTLSAVIRRAYRGNDAGRS